MRFQGLKRAAFVVVPGVAAYEAANWSTGNFTYAPIRSAEEVYSWFAMSPLVNKQINDPRYVLVEKSIGISELEGDAGAISTASLSFRDKENPRNTVAFVHCGPRTIGFPYMVHGGVLASLLRHAGEMAIDKPLTGTLKVKYRLPTYVDNILKIETNQQPDGLHLSIKTTSNDTLVDAMYS